MIMVTWRRAHGADIVAEVRADRRGIWTASAWLQSNPTVFATAPKRFDSPESARDKADDLARRTFDHVCLCPDCGDWLPYEI
jgi:hypothetical protein